MKSLHVICVPIIISVFLLSGCVSLGSKLVDQDIGERNKFHHYVQITNGYKLHITSRDIPYLIQGLRYDSVAVRHTALKLLRFASEDSEKLELIKPAIPDLINCLNWKKAIQNVSDTDYSIDNFTPSPSWKIPEHAEFILKRFDENVVRQHLLPAINEQITPWGIEKIVNFYQRNDPQYIEAGRNALIKLIGSPDYKIRRDALVTYRELGGDKVYLYSNAMDDEELLVRIAAINGLIKLNAGAQHIIKALNDQDSSIRRIAILHISSTKDIQPETFGPLLEMLLKDKENKSDILIALRASDPNWLEDSRIPTEVRKNYPSIKVGLAILVEVEKTLKESSYYLVKNEFDKAYDKSMELFIKKDYSRASKYANIASKLLAEMKEADYSSSEVICIDKLMLGRLELKNKIQMHLDKIQSLFWRGIVIEELGGDPEYDSLFLYRYPSTL